MNVIIPDRWASLTCEHPTFRYEHGCISALDDDGNVMSTFDPVTAVDFARRFADFAAKYVS